jgi:sugar lactone lactonase YvrE
MRVDLYRPSTATLGESLVWDASADAPAMLWCDIPAGIIHRSPLEVVDDDDTEIALPAPVASFHLAEIGGEPGFVVSLGDRIVLTDAGGLELRELARVEHDVAGMRLNEGKVDPAGRWVTGSMDPSGGSAAAFYSVSPDGGARAIRRDIGTGNGLEWSLDGSRIYFTDTAEGTIYTGSYDGDGSIGDVEVFHSGSPHDGLTIDDDGWLWSAHYGEGVVVRYDESGTERERVELPVPNVTSVAFGGLDRRTLFVASAREGMEPDELERYPLSGSVFTVQTETPGRPARVFSASR